ncbi:MAG: hypothetical protein NC924_10140, partial [Candidatus Omnitrophica bacterium]|nr:hypothetical protein [Candidatus Omnitrophota bacterium]
MRSGIHEKKICKSVRCFFLITAAACAGIYLFFQFLFLPFILLPELNQKLEQYYQVIVDAPWLAFHPAGVITGRDIRVMRPSREMNILSVERLVVRTSLPRFLQFIRSDFQGQPLPLWLSAENVRLFPDRAANIRADITADVSVSSNPAATIRLSRMVVDGIPLWGRITDFRGDITLKDGRLYSEELRGMINDTIAKCSFSLTDISAPEFTVDALLFPLQIQSTGSLRDDTLRLNSLRAFFPGIELALHGTIDRLSRDAAADLTLEIDAALHKLKQLPLRARAKIIDADLAGTLNGSMRLQGSLKNIGQVTGTTNFEAANIRWYDKNITALTGASTLRDGILSLETLAGKLAALEFEMQAGIDLARQNIPYDGTLRLKNFRLSSLPPSFAGWAGTVEAAVRFQGNATAWPQLTATLSANGDELTYRTNRLPSPVTLSANVAVEQNFDLRLTEAEFKDPQCHIQADGTITDIFSPHLDVRLAAEIDSSRFVEYPFLALPRPWPWRGLLRMHCRLNGPFGALHAVQIPFEVSSPEIFFKNHRFRNMQLSGIIDRQTVAIPACTADYAEG